jgi:hypothetical protein
MRRDVEMHEGTLTEEVAILMTPIFPLDALWNELKRGIGERK